MWSNRGFVWHNKGTLARVWIRKIVLTRLPLTAELLFLSAVSQPQKKDWRRRWTGTELQTHWITATKEAQSEHPQSAQVCCLQLHHRGPRSFSRTHSPTQVRRLVPPVPAVRPVLHLLPVARPPPLHRPSPEGAAGTRQVQREGSGWRRESAGESAGRYEQERRWDTQHQVQSVWEGVWNRGDPEHPHEDTRDGVHKVKETECDRKVRGK